MIYIYIYVHFSTAAEDAPLLFRGAHLKVTMAAMLSLLPPLKSSKCSSQAIVQTLELSGYVIKLRGCLSGLLFNCPIVVVGDGGGQAKSLQPVDGIKHEWVMFISQRLQKTPRFFFAGHT